MTIRDKDWEKIKEAFFIPRNSIELEKREIYLLHRNEKSKMPDDGKIYSKQLCFFTEQK